MDPVTPTMSLADKKRRRTHLDGQIAASPMRVGKAMRAVAKEVFADGALSRKHKELTALAVAVATNCWE